MNWKTQLIGVCAWVLIGGSMATGALAQDDSLTSGHELTYDGNSPPPALLYSDLLEATQSQVMWRDGHLQIDGTIRALFLPKFEDPSNSYAYNNSTGARLAHQLKTADGTLIETNFYSGQRLKNPFWMLHPGVPNDHSFGTGEHLLEYFLEGKLFYRFPFTVRVQQGGDEYNPDNRYFLDGPWADWAYIYVANNNPGSSAQFSIWLRDDQASPGNWGEHHFSVSFKHNGTLIGEWPGEGVESPYQLKPWYDRYGMNIRGVNGSIYSGDLLKDGTYDVVVTQDGQSYATYQYEVAGGKFQHQAEQIRESTDPLVYVDGGGERFFMKRK